MLICSKRGPLKINFATNVDCGILQEAITDQGVTQWEFVQVLLPSSERFWCHCMEQLVNHLTLHTWICFSMFQ
jgi:hypothetical protein